ncbi:cellulase family glycosylhydrolase [Mucisphaera calidilacus]|uniref:Endoglucanase C307 n=1 Tax=Mucisphaera calidilacus TaxID=2527982 RepID=A0A518BVL9_9BACT|nr:cellulase family glycosylhydrolase [Mucisphaera calidilacus]QDU71026.1 Endoglucanase C307 precursor [Mucisphaera calidilacus]
MQKQPLPRTRTTFTLALILLSACATAVAGSSTHPWIKAEGARFVNDLGEQVTLKGCNVGNWLLLEMWMLAIDHGQFRDQYDFEENLSRRFGRPERERLMDLYRENWIKPRDFAIIKSFGFNTVRLPFNYRLLQDDERPFALRKDAFEWLDRGIEMAEAEGLYVILDMHGVPGGQSVDHPTGRVEQNKLWENPVYADRTAWLWRQIADRYRDRASVAGYDVINEPYADFNTDIRPQLKAVFGKIYDAIREVDERHIVFAPAPLWGGHAFYGSPEENGWTQVAFTEHHYPGLFGDSPTKQSHGRFVYRELPEKHAFIERVRVPMFIGEWNPVFESLGGGDLMRRYFDIYESYGWAAAMWSYKILHREGGVVRDNWYMVSNAKTLHQLDFKTAPIEEIEDYFRWFGSMEYVIDEPMRTALVRENPIYVDLPMPAPPMAEPPHRDALEVWQAADVGEAIEGGQRRDGDDALTIYGGGHDIWTDNDAFRFVCREIEGDFVMTTRIDHLGATSVYAKAGIMARASLDNNSAHVLIHAFPDGQLARGLRHEQGAMMSQADVPNDQLPVYVRLSRRGHTFVGEFSLDGMNWRPAGTPVEVPAIGKTCLLGLAVLSHNAGALTEARFTSITIESW